ncbi:glycosyltransferase [Devosia sp. BSSL-BM10]|uniref:Glycosyltransferase n=1 Tax=Devosia litorisediminis TaxID=2829817 RepID=A0A942E5D6_9HYPH|nr:glycosyltransferase [Devosia litorisediminis]MBS3848548.1 glycosyltransferase [Devosia litorisediminis]
MTSFVVARARFLGCKLVIHHHSYDHVLRRRSSMVLLARIAGPNAVHVVLGQKMAADMRLSTPEVGKIIVLNNAGLVEKKLLSLPENSGSKIVLGHLSNLTAEKGISEVVELAIRLREMSLPVRLVIAGPAGDHAARDAISLARRILGEDFNYKGPVHGNDKIRFFSEITHLIFPTRYKNEASPIVLLEAMAAAVPCISNMRGCISNDLGKEGGVVVEDALKFTSCAINYLTTRNLETASSAARNRYITLKHEYDVQFSNLLRILTV